MDSILSNEDAKQKLFEQIIDKCIEGGINNDCILWTGKPVKKANIIKYCGKRYNVTNFMWKYYGNDTISSTEYFDRICGNGSCNFILHLYTIPKKHNIYVRDIKQYIGHIIKSKSEIIDNDCFILRSKYIDKYSIITINGIEGTLHKFVYIAYKNNNDDKFNIPSHNHEGEILAIGNLCNNPKCFNPDHLDLIVHTQHSIISNASSYENTKKENKKNKQWTPEMFDKAKQKLLSNVEHDPKTECIIYKGGNRMSCNNKQMCTHIMMCEVKYGRHIQKGEYVVKLCDTPNCINEEHLEFSTDKSIIAYNRIKKGKNAFCKIKDNKVIKLIRKLHDEDNLNPKQIINYLLKNSIVDNLDGLSERNVRSIFNYERWKLVSDESDDISNSLTSTSDAAND